MTWELNKRLDWQIRQPMTDQIFGQMRTDVVTVSLQQIQYLVWDQFGLRVQRQVRSQASDWVYGQIGNQIGDQVDRQLQRHFEDQS